MPVFRRYFRLHCFNHSWIAVDAPADKEDNPRFVAVAKAWRDQDVTVPKVIAHDFERGFMLLEDFGDQLLWPALHADGLSEKDLADLYGQAITQLLHIQQLPTDNLPPYDAGLLDREMALFRDWLCQQLLGMALSDAEQDMLHNTFALLQASALAQPVVAVHRDYHSRNLMLRPRWFTGGNRFSGCGGRPRHLRSGVAAARLLCTLAGHTGGTNWRRCTGNRPVHRVFIWVIGRSSAAILTGWACSGI